MTRAFDEVASEQLSDVVKHTRIACRVQTVTAVVAADAGELEAPCIAAEPVALLEKHCLDVTAPGELVGCAQTRGTTAEDYDSCLAHAMRQFESDSAVNEEMRSSPGRAAARS